MKTKDIIMLFLPLAVLYGISVIFEMTNVYDYWYPVSPILHAIGGFITAWTAYTIIRWNIPKRTIKKFPPWVIHFLLVGIVLCIGISWEWYEFISDSMFHINQILGVGDTLIDLTMDIVGALVYSFVRTRVDTVK